jgi:putative hydrolase of the HAD superfamily
VLRTSRIASSPTLPSRSRGRARSAGACKLRAQPEGRETAIWLFDLDNTLHDASHAAFGELHVAMADYIVTHLDVPAEAAGALRERYWLRYGATLLGLVRHHGVRAAHFLDETHRLPGLEARLRTSVHDRAALARLPGRKFIVTNAPRAYALRVLERLRLAPLFEAVITIESMSMFGALRPKPDARMLRRLAARLGVRPSRCVLVEDTLVHLKAARSVGMRSVWMQRYLGGRFRGSLRDGSNAGRRMPDTTRRECPKPPYLYAKIGALRQLNSLL